MREHPPRRRWLPRTVYAVLVAAAAFAVGQAQALTILWLWNTPRDVVDASHRWTIAGVALLVVAAGAAVKLPAQRVALSCSAAILAVLNIAPPLAGRWSLALWPALLTVPSAVTLICLALSLRSRPSWGRGPLEE